MAAKCLRVQPIPVMARHAATQLELTILRTNEDATFLFAILVFSASEQHAQRIIAALLDARGCRGTSSARTSLRMGTARSMSVASPPSPKRIFHKRD